MRPSRAPKKKGALLKPNAAVETPATGLTIKVKFDNSNTGGKNERKKS